MRAAATMIYHIPVFGWMLREAAGGSVTARILFVVNMLLIWLLAILLFGYPAVILPALAATLAMFVVLVAIMMG